jgi:hypothetical protein
MKPSPKWDARKGRWYVDLRGVGLGQRWYAGSPPPGGLSDAIHEAYAILGRERPRVAIVERAPGAGRLLSELAKEYAALRSFKTLGGEDWFRKKLLAVVRDLGALELVQFEPPAGHATVGDWRDGLRAKGLCAKEANDRLCILYQVLKYSARQRCLIQLPDRPKAANPSERLYRPRFLWISESDFRRLREAIYATDTARRALRGALAQQGRPHSDADAQDWICRRRLWLSVGFYCGFHTADLDQIRGDWFHLELTPPRYRVVNQKNKLHRRERYEPMPEPMLLDVQAELDRRGLRRFDPEDYPCGGEWNGYNDVLRRASEAIGLPFPAQPRVLRCSFVREMRLRGYSKDRVRLLMGHAAESAMVDRVYSDVPIADGAGQAWRAGEHLTEGRYGEIRALAEVATEGPRRAPKSRARRATFTTTEDVKLTSTHESFTNEGESTDASVRNVK